MDTATKPFEQSVTKSYHDASAVYAAHFIKFMSVAAIPASVSYVLSMALKVSLIASFTYATGLGDLLSPEHVSSLVTLLLVVTIIFVQTLGVVALIYTVVQHEMVSVLDAFEHALGFFLRFAVVAVTAVGVGLIGLVIGFIPVLIVGVVVGMISVNALTLTFDWLSLLAPIVSAVFSTYVIFAPYILVDKNCSIRSALRQSRQLVRGHFWSTAVRLLLFYSAAIVVVVMLQFVPVAGPLISLLTVTPFTVVYMYTVYKHLEALKH